MQTSPVATINNLAPNYRLSAGNYSAVIRSSRTSNDPAAMDLWHAHQYCFVVTIGQVCFCRSVVSIGWLIS